MSDLPDLDAIRVAANRIAPFVARTSLVRSAAFGDVSGADVRLKLEIEQPTGSFKVRGATNAVRRLADANTVRGVCTASTGNHARAVARVGAAVGLPVRAFVSGTVAAPRLAALRELGADVDCSAQDQTAAIVAAQDFARAEDYGFVPPFDDPDVMAGQGTIGLELAQDVPLLDAVVVPVSGGGLIGGIGLALRELVPSARVIGVCAQNAPAMAESLAAGTPVRVRETPTVATSLMGDLGPDNRYTFRAAQQVIDEIVTVPDERISQAVGSIYAYEDLIVEPAGAAGIAFLLGAGKRFAGQQVAVILTGNAVDE